MHQWTELIDRQLVSYNNKDLEGFMAYYHPQIEAFDFQSGQLLFSGLSALIERYTKRFENPNLHAEIAQRMVLGNKVIDLEQISGVEMDVVQEVIVTYAIEENKIRKVWFMYP